MKYIFHYSIMNFDRIFFAMQDLQENSLIEEDNALDNKITVDVDEDTIANYKTVVIDNTSPDTKEEIKCNWQIGQIVWSRVGNYPFWPCIVTNDPILKIFNRIRFKGASRVMEIHVHYFGDNGRHSWVLANYIFEFTSLEDFKKLYQSLTPDIKKKDPKYAAAFIVKPGLKGNWNEAVYEATYARSLSDEKRSKFFTQTRNNTMYKTLKKIEQISEIKIEPGNEATTSTDNKENISNNKNKKYKAQKLYMLRGASRINESEVKIGDFKVYYQRMRDFIKDEYPDVTDYEIKTYLRKVWETLNTSMKSYFQ